MAKEKAKRKKQTRRSKAKFPALKPEYNLKTRYEEIADMRSYMSKLNDKEKEWLNKFAEEYVNASFPKKGTKEYKKRLHKSKALELDCYNKNNSRGRDIFSKSQACGKLSDINDVKEYNEHEEPSMDGEDEFGNIKSIIAYGKKNY